MTLSRKEASTPVVESTDNRGDDTVHFGFVYFTDGMRVGYAEGVSAQPVFAVEWRGQTSTDTHVVAAIRHLRGLGYKI
jgi:hypothetical protein